MVQEIIVAIIGIAVLIVSGRRIYRFFHNDNKGICDCPACHCSHVVKKR